MNSFAPVYDSIGKNYNSTRQADPLLLSRLLSLLSPRHDGLYLDVGCGTGNFTSALAELGFSFTGVDPSETMLAVAREKSDLVQWLPGTAEKLPAEDGTFNAAIATLTLHHWKELGVGFLELYRVLVEGARVVLFTSTPEQMEGYWLNHYFPHMLRKSIDAMPTMESVVDAANSACFTVEAAEPFFVHQNLKDHFLYAGKQNPALYFIPSIRAGISSFSAFAHKPEVDAGLKQLQADIETGAFQKVQESYANNLGDYLFLCLRKAAA